MMARQRKPTRKCEDVGRDVGRVHHFEVGQRQRAGLVEDDMIGFGKPLDGIAGVEQHAGFEHRARRHRLHGRDRKAERAGTGDDQHRDAGDDRIVPARARQHPAEHGQERGRMHDRRIKPRGAIGEPHVARARLQRIVQQPRDLGQQRRLGRSRHPHPQRAGHVERAGIDRACPARPRHEASRR